VAFHLYRENKLEVLAERFVREVYQAQRIDSAFSLTAAHTVVVQTRGMAEYLKQFIATRCGIAANLEMPFVNAFIDRIFRALYGEAFRQAAYRSDQKNIRKEVMKLLRNDRAGEVAPELEKYLCGVNSELKTWQLAGKLADLFDQYQLYRSKELYEEKLFKKNDWQGAIYNRIFNAEKTGRNDFFEDLRRNGISAEQAELLPPEISVFGVGALPPVYLDILVRLSEHCRVNFFYLAPCLEYWEDQLSKSEQRQKAWSVAESGNPILQALGRQGRGFFTALLANDNIAPDWEPDFRAPDDDPGTTMLEVMQHDILYLFDRREVAEEEERNNPEADLIGRPRRDLQSDQSIAIHNCHSIRRELEVLHDELLKLIQQGVKPQNIIVMAPDIVRCAPVINAVFSSGALRNVYSIADLPPGASSMASEAFHRIFEVAASRFEFSSVMTLLDLPFIAEALDITPETVSEIAQLLQDCGVRWGFDGAMRQRFCQADFDEFSWQMAIDRLLAGFACRSSDDSGAMLGNIKTLEALEGGELEPFARVVKLLENLAALSMRINTKHSMPVWLEIFRNICDDFLGNGNLQRTAMMPLRNALAELENLINENVLPGVYPLNAALEILDDLWGADNAAGRFLRGKITFCRMVPMRSIPMDVVAILDLNEGDFPRRTTGSGFDLMAADSQAGDRSQPVQDRYLLLEALLAARKHLLLFYQGRSALDNQEKPPCAPLSEIADYLKNAFGLEEFKHKLSGIDPEYFKAGSEYASLDQENFKAVENMQKYRGNTDYDEPEKVPAEFYGVDCSGELELRELEKFFANPCQYLIRSQLGLYLQQESESAGDDEPWTLAPIDNWKVDRMFMAMPEANDDTIYHHTMRSNLLPPGEAGRKEFDRRSGIMHNLPLQWRQWLESMYRMPVVFTVNGIAPAEEDSAAGKCCRINGMVNISSDQSNVLVFKLGRYKAASALQAVLGAMAAALTLQRPVGAQILNLNKSEYEQRKIEPVTPEAALQKFRELLALASASVSKPLPLFPQASVYWEDEAQAKNSFYSLFKFEEIGDVTDPYIRIFYTRDDWFDEQFREDFRFYAQMLYSWIVPAAEVNND